MTLFTLYGYIYVTIPPWKRIWNIKSSFTTVYVGTFPTKVMLITQNQKITPVDPSDINPGDFLIIVVVSLTGEYV